MNEFNKHFIGTYYILGSTLWAGWGNGAIKLSKDRQK